MAYKYNLYKDGLTQSFLAAWLECREKAKLAYLEGWRSSGPSRALDFGTMVHNALDMCYSRAMQKKKPTNKTIKNAIIRTSKAWKKEHPRASLQERQDFERWKGTAQILLEEYFRFYEDDFREMQWESLEEVFSVKHGKVPIRGKFDGVFRLKKKLWLFETKTKSRIDEDFILTQLPMDLQVNVYVWALEKLRKEPVRGVLYNVLRTPGLLYLKTETLNQHLGRVRKDIRKRPEWYFIRYENVLIRSQVEEFKPTFGKMVEEVDGWFKKENPHYPNPCACMTKYGACAFLQKCATGSEVGLAKAKTPHKELVA